MEFLPEDPFPLLPEGAVPYEDEKKHSALVDEWLGLRVSATEKGLRPGADEHERWIKQGPSTFMTPYTELRRIFHALAPAPDSHIVDLGAAYGRIGFLLARHYPGTQFTGYELVPERVNEGRRVLALQNCSRAKLLQADIGNLEIPPAEIYFLYDFGTRAAVNLCLEKLKKRSPFILVGRGGLVRDLIAREHPWLGEVQEPRHAHHYSIYQCA